MRSHKRNDLYSTHKRAGTTIPFIKSGILPELDSSSRIHNYTQKNTGIQIDADPDAAYHFDADPDQVYHFEAGPDPDPQHFLENHFKSK